jgi:hypothetical protein
MLLMPRQSAAAGHESHLEEAKNPATPAWRLAELADDADLAVRMAVATHPTASQLTRLRLSKDPDSSVAELANQALWARP